MPCWKRNCVGKVVSFAFCVHRSPKWQTVLKVRWKVSEQGNTRHYCLVSSTHGWLHTTTHNNHTHKYESQPTEKVVTASRPDRSSNATVEGPQAARLQSHPNRAGPRHAHTLTSTTQTNKTEKNTNNTQQQREHDRAHIHSTTHPASPHPTQYQTATAE